MKRLTIRQREVLTFIAGFATERGYGPSIREIGNALGIRSTNGVNDHLVALERKGYLFRDAKHRARSLLLTEQAREELGIKPSPRVAIGRVVDVDEADGTATVELTADGMVALALRFGEQVYLGGER